MGAEDGMWTEAHRARHEPGLKELVAACAVEEVAAWLERADPPRSGRATPVRRGGGVRGVVGAGRPGGERAGDAGPARGRRGRLAFADGRPLARPAGRLAAVADRVPPGSGPA